MYAYRGIFIFIHTHINICIYLCIYIHTYIYTHTHTHTHTHTNTHTHIHTCTHTLLKWICQKTFFCSPLLFKTNFIYKEQNCE